MKKIELLSMELLVIDPCYIASVKPEGALREVKKFHQGDGTYAVEWQEQIVSVFPPLVGADSGEVSLYRAEKDCVVESEDGLSGHLKITRHDCEMAGRALIEKTLTAGLYD